MAVPGGYDFARTAWFKGIGATGRAFGAPRIVARDRGGGFWATLGGWRQCLNAHVLSRVEGAEGAVAASFVTGYQGRSRRLMPRRCAAAASPICSRSAGFTSPPWLGRRFLTLKLLALSPTLALRWPLVLIAAGVGALAGSQTR